MFPGYLGITGECSEKLSFRVENEHGLNKPKKNLKLEIKETDIVANTDMSQKGKIAIQQIGFLLNINNRFSNRNSPIKTKLEKIVEGNPLAEMEGGQSST